MGGSWAGSRARLFGSRLFGSRLFGSRLFGSRLFGSRLFGSRLFGSRVRLFGSRARLFSDDGGFYHAAPPRRKCRSPASRHSIPPCVIFLAFAASAV